LLDPNELTFNKFGVMDHVDITFNAQARLYDIDWTQIDHCIVSWIYLTVSKDIRDMVFQHYTTAHSLWLSIHSLFRNNTTQHAIYALQDFHSLALTRRRFNPC
jgi:hypothetical protein